MLLPNGTPTKFGNLVPKPRLKRKGRKISVANSSNISWSSETGAPDLGHPPSEELRRVTGLLGVTHYVQAALCILVAVFAAWWAYSSWQMYNLPNHGYAADDDSFAAGLGATMDQWRVTVFPGISCFLFVFGGFSFLVGNRLIRHQSRRFCRAFAIFECVLGAALVVAGFLILLLVRLGVIDGDAGAKIAIACFLSFPLTVIPFVIGSYTLRMLSRQGASFVSSAPGKN
jgi:uncharacterized membrane protein YozB (DUF420 family)